MTVQSRPGGRLAAIGKDAVGKAALVLAAVSMAAVACGGSSDDGSDGGGSGSPVDVGAPLPAALKGKGRLAMGVKCDYPPYAYIDEGGKNAGFEIAIARKFASYAFGKSSAVTLTCVTGANRVPYLTTKRIDLILATMNYTQERAATIDFSKPYFNSGVKLLVPKSSPVTSFADLAGKQVITINGSTGSIWLTQCMKDVKQVPFGQTSEAFTALRQNRGAAFAQDDTLLYDLASKNPDLKVVGDEKAGSPWGMGVRRGDKATLAWVDAAIKKMQDEDFFWTEFQKSVKDKAVQAEFQKFLPRPGNDLAYPTGSVYKC